MAKVIERAGVAVEHLSLEAFRNPPFPVVTVGDRPIYDTVAALICHGVLTRHPSLRVATIESGSDWVPSLRRKLAKSYAQTPSAYGHDPVEQLQRSVWVSPYYEDDLHAVRDAIGVERIIFGSDYPHAEGSFRRSQDLIAEQFVGVPDDERKAMLGGTLAGTNTVTFTGPFDWIGGNMQDTGTTLFWYTATVNFSSANTKTRKSNRGTGTPIHWGTGVQENTHWETEAQ